MREEQQLGALQPEQTGVRQPSVLPAEGPERTIVLCVSEDMTSARGGVVAALRRAGFEVDLVEARLFQPSDIQARPYRAVVVDVNKSNGVGFKLVRQIRDRSVVPIMLVLHGTARNDILLGFQNGADAYVLAPFDERELGARMRGLLQRTPGGPVVV